jgi:TolB-like protein/Tfp pilus assembly protein PilF
MPVTQQWARVKELFATCMQLPAKEREAFLDRASVDDSIRKEVLSIIASYQQSGDFLEAPAALSLLDPSTVPAAAAVAHLEPGTRLGPYKILEPLGSGGMGVVYRAEDVRLERTVALKIMPPSVACHAGARQRFEQEARAISRLNHPHICALYDVGSHNGVEYLVMELLEGMTLARQLEEGPLPHAAVLRHGIEIADALDRAHRHGVVHLDLKPSNVVLTESGAKLLDFGIATLHGRHAGAGAAGTEAYMSPEQVRGEQVDERSDLFSFGAMLHEMAYGRRQLGPVVGSHDGLDSVIAKALEPDRARRYQRASDIYADLERLERAVHLRPARTWFRTRVFVAAALVVVASGGLAMFMSRRSNPPVSAAVVRSVAVLPFKPLVGTAGEDNYMGVALADALITEFGAIETVAVRPLSASSRYATPGTDPVAAGRELNADLVVDGAIQRSGDQLRVSVQLVRVADGSTIWSDRFDSRWTDVFRVQDAIAEQVTRALAVTLTGEDRQRVLRRRPQNLEAYDEYLKGRYFWSMRTADALEKALGYFQRAIDREPTYGPAHAGLADTYALLGSLAVAALPPKEAGQKAIAAATQALQIDETLAEAHVSFAFATYSFEWNWDRAEGHFRRAIELDPDYPTAHHWYALYLGQLGRLDEALAEAQRGLRLEPLSLVGTYAVGLAHYQARRFDLAREYAGRLLEVAPEFPHGSRLMGSVEIAEGRYEPAIVLHERLHAAHPGSSLYAAWLAHAYGKAGDRVRAQKILDDLIATSRTRYVSSANIAIGYIGLDDDTALSWLEKGYAERSQALTFLKIDPVYDPLRSDPRFVDLLRRVGLGP